LLQALLVILTPMILLLGDLHIGLGDSQKKLELLKFILNGFSHAEKVVFLGDIFDFYYECPETVMELYGEFLSTLKNLRAQKEVLYVQGNHDFFPMKLLINCGVKLSAKGFKITYHGKSIYLTHGDLLTLSGLMTRIFLSFPLWNILMKLIPCPLIYGIARRISTLSRKRSSSKALTESIPEPVRKLFKKYDIVVTAHFHKPVAEKLGEGKIYVNPGDWLEYYTFGVITDGKVNIFKVSDNEFIKLSEVEI